MAGSAVSGPASPTAVTAEMVPIHSVRLVHLFKMQPGRGGQVGNISLVPRDKRDMCALISCPLSHHPWLEKVINQFQFSSRLPHLVKNTLSPSDVVEKRFLGRGSLGLLN